MDLKDAVSILEFLPKTVLAVAVLVAVILFHKPISERFIPSLRSAEVWGIKFEFVKSELQVIEKSRAKVIESELRWSFSEAAFGALRDRAERLKEVLPGMRILWVDDQHPTQNVHERRALGGLGVLVDAVQTTDQALRLLDLVPYEAVITDYSRPDDEGATRLLDAMGKKNMHRQAVFYSGKERPVPVGAHGFTTLPDELIHLIMDLAERRRTVGGWLTRE